MLELVLKQVGFGWVIVANIGKFDARRAVGTLGRRGCVFEVTRGPRGSYICVGYVGKSVFAFEVRNVMLYILSFGCRVDDSWLN